MSRQSLRAVLWGSMLGAGLALSAMRGSNAHAATSVGEVVALDDATCGVAGKPDCPLQSWMKGNMSSAKSSADFGKLQGLFAKIATFVPKEAPFAADWIRMSNAGLAAAKVSDMDGVKKACLDCHSAYRKPYKDGFRSHPISG